MNTSTATATEVSELHMRRRLYGLCLIVSLSILVVTRINDDPFAFVHVYAPLIGATMLALGLAGTEWQVFINKTAAERQTRAQERDRAEEQAIARQRSFNELWQQLADSRGESMIPAAVLTDLRELFSADFVAVWSDGKAPGEVGYHLRGALPIAEGGSVRLDKVGQASPCFEVLRQTKRQMRMMDFPPQTTRSLAWFCEEHQLQQAVMCPVLVRHELVGVLAFFYKDKPPVSSRLTEEMQAAANLFLCAF